MSLDLTRVIGQIVDFAASLKSKEGERKAKLEFALKTLKPSAADINGLKQKVEASRTTWLVAGLKENIDLGQTAPGCPDDFILSPVMASASIAPSIPPPARQSDRFDNRGCRTSIPCALETCPYIYRQILNSKVIVWG